MILNWKTTFQGVALSALAIAGVLSKFDVDWHHLTVRVVSGLIVACAPGVIGVLQKDAK